jgi:peptidoglycan/xylan/chitin deacetylase (PgdA/CDA1 family)
MSIREKTMQTLNVVLLIGLGLSAMAAAEERKGGGAEAEILKWKDGKKAVFMLEFDDSCETHIKNAIPELKKRNMVGTFYINPGNGPFKNKAAVWEKEIPATGMEYGNHTFTHVGAPSLEVVDKDIQLCADAIDKCFSDRKKPRLVSFGQPGGVPWKISAEETKQLLAKYNLIDRPPFFGYPFHVKTKEEMLKLVDTALAKGEMGHHDFHGVGGDWHVTPMDIFIALLDKLDANREQLWITDPVSWHKYRTERQGAELKVVQKGATQIKLALACKTDAALYDLPLTLAVKVPADWKECEITQGRPRHTVVAKDGEVRFDAEPVSGEIVIGPAGSLE